MKSRRTKDNYAVLWYGVHDRQTRKRVQDRLAQRARRKRLAEAKGNVRKSLTTQQLPLSNPELNIQETSSVWNQSDHHDNLAPEEIALPQVDSSTLTKTCTSATSSGARHPDFSTSISDTQHKDDTPSTSTSTGLIQPVPAVPGSESSLSEPFLPSNRALRSLSVLVDHHYLDSPRSDLLAAMKVCGDILDIICCMRFETCARQHPNIPEMLQPSPLQLAVAHYGWIDKLPFPRLRDNLILLAQNIDLQDLFEDIFTTDAFIIPRENPPWDPAGWSMCPKFHMKWGYLFH